MSGLIGKIMGFVSGGLLGSVADVADKFIQSDDEKAAFKLELEKVLQKRDSEVEQTIRAELGAKERIIVAEMNQGDNYTKRARPTLIYFGLAMIFINYLCVPLIQLMMSIAIKPFEFPAEFWMAWGGAVSIYSVGRSMEKRGTRNGLSAMATGSKPNSLFD